MSDRKDHQLSLSDAETFKLLEKANLQYEEYVKLRDTPDFTDEETEPRPVYSWKNPIGLVISSPDPHPTTPEEVKGARLV